MALVSPLQLKTSGGPLREPLGELLGDPLGEPLGESLGEHPEPPRAVMEPPPNIEMPVLRIGYQEVEGGSGGFYWF